MTRGWPCFLDRCVRTLVLILAMCAQASALSSGRVEMRVEPPPEGIVLGRPFHVVLEAGGSLSGLVRFPELLDLGPRIEVLTAGIRNNAPPGFRSRRYKVMAIVSGSVEIPRVELLLECGGSVMSNRAEIEVRSPLAPDECDIREPDLLMVPPEKATDIFYGCLLFAVAVCVGILGWFFSRRFVNAPEQSPPLPHETALIELDGLKSALLETQDDLDAFYIRLSRIIRLFIQARFFVDAMEKTTDETVDSLGRSSLLNDEELASLCRLFDRSDLVKFAGRHGTGPGPAREDLSRALVFVGSFADEQRSYGNTGSLETEEGGG